MKARLKGAQTGRNLLKKKADALTIRFRQILKRIIDTKTLMGVVMREAALSLAEAKFTMGDFSQQILQNVNKASIKVKAKKDNVAGLLLDFVKKKGYITSRICIYFILFKVFNYPYLSLTKTEIVIF
jgi:H(+)-transporting ATP synthase subunit D